MRPDKARHEGARHPAGYIHPHKHVIISPRGHPLAQTALGAPAGSEEGCSEIKVDTDVFCLPHQGIRDIGA